MELNIKRETFCVKKKPYRFLRTAFQSFTKQIAVCTVARECQHKYIVFHPVDQKLIGKNMAFPVAGPITGKCMVFVPFRQSFSHCKQRDDFIQQCDFQTAFHRRLIVFFELRGKLDGQFGFPHFLRSANNASKSV